MDSTGGVIETCFPSVSCASPRCLDVSMCMVFPNLRNKLVDIETYRRRPFQRLQRNSCTCCIGLSGL